MRSSLGEFARSMRGLAERTRRSALVGSSATLVGGTVLAQGITFAASPLLSRLYGPSDFGILATYNAWVAILALASCLRYEHALVVTSGTDESNRVLALTGVLCALSVGAYLVVAVAVYAGASDDDSSSVVREIALLVPAGIVAACLSSPFLQLYVKLGRFRLIAFVAAIQALVTVAVQVAFAAGGIASGLIVGTIVGYVVAGLLYILKLPVKHRLAQIVQHIRLTELRSAAAKFSAFPRFTLPSDAIATVSQYFVPVFVLGLFGPATAGLYAFSLRVTRLPVLVVAAAVLSIVRSEGGALLSRNRPLSPLLLSVRRGLLGVGIAALVLAALVVAPLFGQIFGPQWTAGEDLVRVLTPGILAEFVALPLGAFFLLTGSQRISLIVNSLGFLLTIAALLAGKAWFGEFLPVAALLSGSALLVNAWSVILAGRVTRRADGLAPSSALDA